MAKPESRAFLLCMLAACVLFNGCHDKQDQVLEAELRGRIKEFYACLSKEEYDKAWLILLPKQREFSWPRETWVNMQKGVDPGKPREKLVSYEIEKIKLVRVGEKVGAFVRTIYTFKMEPLGSEKTRIEKLPWSEGWQYEKGEWYRLEGD